MSEYQYYEFRAIDRRLRQDELARVRARSSRAEITPTSFVNKYEWGDFRGNVDNWMTRYFDAHLYLANWGTHTLKFRLPARLLDPDSVKPFCDGEAMAMKRTGEFVIVSFGSISNKGDSEDPEGRLELLLPVRSELMSGDHRALYLGWLLSVMEGSRETDELEPPVPPGLDGLSPALQKFAEFLRIDPDLIAAAATCSGEGAIAATAAAELKSWLAARSAPEKDQWLSRRLMQGEPALAAELMQRFMRAGHSDGRAKAARPARRTVNALMAAAQSRRADRRRHGTRQADLQ